MRFASANKVHRKFGEAQPRDLQFHSITYQVLWQAENFYGRLLRISLPPLCAIA
jgi:hypothetical protein